MKTISVNTTQNVSIEYELGSLRDRIFAYIIDMIVMVVIMWGIAIVVLLVNQKSDMLMAIVAGFVFIFYTFLSEYFMNGQSLGKKALRLKVVKISGEEAGLSDYTARWAFRAIDIYFSFGSIASMLIGSSQKSQRIGDIVANTAVVYIKPSREVSITQIVSSYDAKNYVVTYPNAKHFNETEMLVVKTTIERWEKYNNDAHHDAIIEAATIIRDRLNLDIPIHDSKKFLKTVLQDYIVLTR